MDSRKGRGLHDLFGPNKIAHGKPGTRGKGDSEKMSVCLGHLERRFRGFSALRKLRGSRKSQFTRKRQEGVCWTCGVATCSCKCIASSRTPIPKGKDSGYLLSSNAGLHPWRLKTALWHRELRWMKGCDLPRATQPRPQLGAPPALGTAVQPTQHLSHFLGTACSFSHHSSLAARDHVLLIQQAHHMAQGLPRGLFRLATLREHMVICSWELSANP